MIDVRTVTAIRIVSHRGALTKRDAPDSAVEGGLVGVLEVDGDGGGRHGHRHGLPLRLGHGVHQLK